MQSQHSLELRQRQNLALTPALQQSIRFLQLSSLELQQELAQAVLDNPLLDVDQDAEAEDTAAAEAPALTADWHRAPQRRFDQDGDNPAEVGPAVPETLQEHLLRQLDMMRLAPRDAALVHALAHELDQDGYLADSVADIANHFGRYMPLDQTDVAAGLTILQSLEPAGVGARSLSECLDLQLARIQTTSKALDADVVSCAQALVRDHLNLLATGNLDRVRRALGCSAALLGAAHALVLSLEPRPARDWATDLAAYVTPDVLVRKHERGWRALLNQSAAIRVRVHPLYSKWLDRLDDAGELRPALQQAQTIVKNVAHRHDTILRVSQAIVDHQDAYFEHGVRAMRPLTLREIAEGLGMHESTVSRATRGKYAQTPYGVIELRRFFGSTLQAAAGATTSARAVQSLIASIVASEPAARPFSDNRLAQLLEQQGIKVARRTVAKYREAAGIESAIRRKARRSVPS